MIKKGQLVVDLTSNIVYTVKYVIAGRPIVSSGSYDFPLYEFLMLETSLLKELV